MTVQNSDRERDGERNSESSASGNVCAGCGLKIKDRFYLVAVERTWHQGCLTCTECRRPLDTDTSCFCRQSSIYCRDDYYR